VNFIVRRGVASRTGFRSGSFGEVCYTVEVKEKACWYEGGQVQFLL
jgi:hypothetical protein